MSFIIWGWGSETKGTPTGKQKCPHCKHVAFHEKLDLNKHFDLFFVPVYNYGNKSWLRCNACGYDYGGSDSPATGVTDGFSQFLKMYLFLIFLVVVVFIVIPLLVLFAVGATVVFGFLGFFLSMMAAMMGGG